jgi:hypothetical protein
MQFEISLIAQPISYPCNRRNKNEVTDKLIQE